MASDGKDAAMTGRMRVTRLFVGLGLGLAFFGCVGLPRRQPPTESALQRQRDRGTPLSIPADPKPVEQVTQISTTVPPASPAGEAPATPASPVVPTTPIAAMRQLHALAERQHIALRSYIVTMTRREVVHGKKQPEELILFKFRKQPRSVYMKWGGPVGKGREAIWVEGKYEGKLHTLLAAGDMPFAPAGKQIALAPDSIFVRNNSRHLINDAGVGTLIDRIGQVLDAIEKGSAAQGTLTYLGKQPRPEFPQPLEAIEWTLPPNLELGLPKGGRRWCYLDSETHLPALIVTHDERGQEVEYYRYERYLLQVELDDHDFDPAQWDARKPMNKNQ